MKRILATAAVIGLVATGATAGWFTPEPPSSDKEMSQKAEAQNKQIDQMVGYPSIINGFEKRMVRMLYELRDDPEFRTYSYMVTLQGTFVKICDSIGYGINASIQFSNPEKLFRTDLGQYDGNMTMPQAEPNGLFMPEGLAATYVLCLNPETEDVQAVYVEPEVIVSPFPMGVN